MNECRQLTKEEFACIAPALEKCGVRPPFSVSRFLDTKLDKIYDVYLLDRGEKSVLKKTNPAEKDMGVYSRYFDGHYFAVPKILNAFSVGEDHFVQMEFADGPDARGCSETEGNRIGKALADIQSYYLTAGGRTEKAESYFNKQIGTQIEAIRHHYPEYSAVFHFVEQRFFEAPQTLIHDDFLPINVLLNNDHLWIIDWEYADILPYFLDLGRFAYVCDLDNRFYISQSSAESFLKSYYHQMKKNPEFCVGEKEFRLDVAISAFCQYVLFVACSLNAANENPSDQLSELAVQSCLEKIMQHIRAECILC